MTMGGKADDDINELKWIPVEEFTEDLFVDTHKGIFQIVKQHYASSFKLLNSSYHTKLEGEN